MNPILIIFTILLAVTIQNKQNNMLTTNERLLEDFSTEHHLEWQIINDGVMGGMSEGRFKINSDQTADFGGTVSLENNGGFASVRALLNKPTTGNFGKIALRVKGDGKRYSFRIRTDVNFDGVAYASTFATKKDEWTEHEFVPADFTPTFRGRILQNVTPLNEAQIRQIGFLISDKQTGNFSLKLDWIKIAEK
ncbi:MAG: CIA30 family protein [Prolixibacteraceae bacterium]|nr:CIA30 family protein [Prolixibacteraceae bacterium]